MSKLAKRAAKAANRQASKAYDRTLNIMRARGEQLHYFTGSGRIKVRNIPTPKIVRPK